MHRRASLMLVGIILLVTLTATGCNFPQAQAEPIPSALTNTPFLPQPSDTLEVIPATATLTATATSLPPTPIPPTDTPSPTPTPTWIYTEPGLVIAPILLYHQVEGDVSYSRYTVSIPDFRAQMQTLYDQGYTAITISTLLDVLFLGGELPEKPVVITFDDGYQSVYDNAFPIMEEFGFPGVFYIVANRINDIPNFVNLDEMANMVAAGWEIGSHSFTHLDVTTDHASAEFEIAQSRLVLQTATGEEIRTFAYPYGKIDPFVASKVSNAGYSAGMGLGVSVTHSWNTVFYLSRVEVYSNYNLDTFVELLQPK